jgi:hypothetical protein
MGLMTRDDLMRLLMIQDDRKRSIEEILVAQGVLTKQQAQDEMAAYRQSVARRRAGSVMPSKIVTVLRAQHTAPQHADAATAV